MRKIHLVRLLLAAGLALPVLAAAQVTVAGVKSSLKMNLAASAIG